MQLLIKYSKYFRRAVVKIALASVTFRTATFSKQLLFLSTFNLKGLSGVLLFLGTATFKRIYLKHHVFVKKIGFFQSTTSSRQFLKVVCYLFRDRSSGRSFIFFNCSSFSERSSLSHPFYHLGRFLFNEAVAVIHFYRGYIEQIIFESS